MSLLNSVKITTLMCACTHYFSAATVTASFVLQNVVKVTAYHMQSARLCIIIDINGTQSYIGYMHALYNLHASKCI